MIYIAVCDDDQEWLIRTERLIRRFGSDNPEYSFVIELYTDTQELLDEVKSCPYHIYFLDILMPGMNGLEFARKIRREDARAEIIFMTSSTEYAVDSYSVQAFYYMLKPFDEKEMYPVLERVFPICEKEKEIYQMIKTKKGVYPIYTGDIVCVEYHFHYLTYYLKDGRTLDGLMYRESFDCMAKSVLLDARFLKVSASFIINMDQVERVSSRSFCMKNGKELPISRKFMDVKKQYFEYLLKGAVRHDI